MIHDHERLSSTLRPQVNTDRTRSDLSGVAGSLSESNDPDTQASSILRPSIGPSSPSDFEKLSDPCHCSEGFVESYCYAHDERI